MKKRPIDDVFIKNTDANGITDSPARKKTKIDKPTVPNASQNDVSTRKNKKKQKKKQKNGHRTDEVNVKQKSEVKKADPWAAIEHGTAVAAATVFKKQSGAQNGKQNGQPEQPKPQNRRDQGKKKRANDGMTGNIHGHPLRRMDIQIDSNQPQKAAKVAEKEQRTVHHRLTIEEIEEEEVIRENGNNHRKQVSKKTREERMMVEGVDYFVQMPDNEEKSQNDNVLLDILSSDSSDEDFVLDEDDEIEEPLHQLLANYVKNREMMESSSDLSDEEDEEDGDQNPKIFHLGSSEDDEDDEEDEDEEITLDEDSDLDQEDEEEDEELSDDSQFIDDQPIDEEDGDSSSITSEESLEVAFVPDRKAKILETSTNKQKKPLEAPIDFKKFPFNESDDSTVAATKALGWILSNCGVQTFFSDFWQKNALVVRRHNPDYYGSLLSVREFSEVISEKHLEYGKNINVAEYRDGVRYTMNGEGRVYPRHLQNHLSEGHSIQLVNPQSFFPNVWYLCDALQELFGCFVGANSYLTPPGSSGFAPHWDEIDAFLLQLEGRKRWRVYAPDSEDNELPRESSGNFTDRDFAGREPCFEGWLERGDLLYLPRGFIHQEVHSFHVTVSIGRRHAFADMMERLLPLAVEQVIQSRLKLREGLPPGYLDMTGVAEIDYKNVEHEEEKLTIPMSRHLSSLCRSAREAVPVAVDLMAREFMRTALPPMLTNEEKRLSARTPIDLFKGKRLVFSDRSQVRLIRRHAQRLIFESPESCFIVHRIENSLDYEARPEQQFSLPIKLVDGFARLQSAYPEWTQVGEIGSKRKQSLELVRLFYDHGLLMVKE